MFECNIVSLLLFIYIKYVAENIMIDKVFFNTITILINIIW